MSQIQSILLKLQKLDIKLCLEEGRLLYDAPQNAMTPEIISQIKQQKNEIISFLQAKSDQKIPSILPVSREQQLPLSFAQERLWFIDQFEGASPVYNLSKIFKLKGKLDLNALENAIDHLGKRHESFRSNFKKKEGKPYLTIKKEINLPLTIINLENLQPSEQELEKQKIIKQEILTAFDLENDPLIKFTLLKVVPQKNILIIVIHHIITDGWSLEILTKELSHLYQAYRNNIAPTLAPLPIQYVDFSLWQRQYFKEKILNYQLSYWQKKLQNIPPTLSFPLDKPRPQIQTFNGATKTFTLSSDLTKQLKIFSQENQVTLFITFLSAFSILLFRYSNQRDLIIGSPIANRNRQDIEGIIGFFVNSLPLRINLDENLTFAELLEQVKITALDAYEHQDLPFEKLVEELKVERNLSHNPLFQVLFVFQNTPDSAFNLENLEVDIIKAKKGTSKFDLSLFIREKGEELNCIWEYKTDLFNGDTIERITDHFKTLVTAIISNYSQKISLLPLLKESEKQQILFDWNKSNINYPQDKCIHQLFEEQVEKTPEHIAVIFEEQTLTYQELNEKANQLAHYLQKLAVKPEILVGICLDRSLEMIIGILGILKAGGAYVPIDPNSPIERLKFILEDANIDILLTQKSLLNQLPSELSTILCLDQENLFSKEEKTNPVSQIKPNNLIYIIYTSGSTGKPKGVEITHHNVVSLFYSTQSYYQFSAQDKWTLFHSFAFDFAVWEIWGALIYGGSLIIVPYEVSRSPEQFYQLLWKQKITVLNQTPSAFNQLIGFINQQKNQDPLELRLIIFGGEKLNCQTLKPWYECQKNSNCQLVNMYGITEITVHATYQLISEHFIDSKQSLIGKPLPDLNVYILDQNLQPVPIGVAGELHIAGNGVARGYLHRPELTAKKFINNPFAEGKLYKTGDLARYLPDGNIEFLERIDNQVKIRGFRIELGEIEAVLRENSAIQDTVVTVREDITDDQRLIAYIIPSSNQSSNQSLISQKELRSFLQQKLPEYMIPNMFVSLEAFPLTSNGKVDLRSLPIPDSITSRENDSFVGPRDELETQLVQIWSKILGIQPIGIHDNFFEIGGHSLLTVRLVAEIEKTLNQKLPIATLFQLTTVAQVADSLRQSHSDDSSTQKDEIITENNYTTSHKDKSTSIPKLPMEDYRALLTTHTHWKSPRMGTKSLILQTQAGNPQDKLPIWAVGGMGDMHHHLRC